MRHLDIIGIDLNEMPKEMSRLGSLQTLSNFVVSIKSGSTVKEFLGGGDFVSSWNTSNFKVAKNVVSTKDIAKVGLVEKTQLDEIFLEWNGDMLIRKMIEMCLNSFCLIQI